MIQAAIDPETKEFLGLIVPAADLGRLITIFGTAEDWTALLGGVAVDPQRVGVLIGGEVRQCIPEAVEVDNLACPPGGTGDAS